MNKKELIGKDIADSFLEHYGVSGMKWGRRNGPPYPLDSEGKAALKKQKADDKAVKKDRKNAEKRRRTMSDEELDSRIKRLEKEKRLKELTDADVNRGKRVVQDFLSSTGGKVLKGAAVAVTGAAVVTIAKSPAFKDLVRRLPYSSDIKATITKTLGKTMSWDQFVDNWLVPALKPKKK